MRARSSKTSQTQAGTWNTRRAWLQDWWRSSEFFLGASLLWPWAIAAARRGPGRSLLPAAALIARYGPPRPCVPPDARRDPGRSLLSAAALVARCCPPRPCVLPDAIATVRRGPGRSLLSAAALGDRCCPLLPCALPAVRCGWRAAHMGSTALTARTSSFSHSLAITGREESERPS